MHYPVETLDMLNEEQSIAKADSSRPLLCSINHGIQLHSRLHLIEA